jgi:hypothetical protein
MNEEELKIIFPDRKHVLPESKNLIKTYKNLISEMANTKDKDIVKIGHFYPLWIIDLCQRATHSITAFIEEKDLPVYRFLQKTLSSADLEVHLMIKDKPKDYNNLKFVSQMHDMNRLQMCPHKIYIQNILVVDNNHFLVKRYDETEKKQYMGAFYQPELAHQIKTYLMSHWSEKPEVVATRSYIPTHDEGRTK